jgi:hypothetical protein
MSLNEVPNRELGNPRKHELIQIIEDLRFENERLRFEAKMSVPHYNPMPNEVPPTNGGYYCPLCFGSGPERNQIRHKMSCPRWHS